MPKKQALSSRFVLSVLMVMLTACQPKPEEKTMTTESSAVLAVNQSGIKADRQFSYVAPVPSEQAKLFGVGAIGDSELTSLVVKIDKNHVWQLQKRQDDKTLIVEGAQNEEQIKASLKKYLSDMAAEGVLGVNMHFVVSSGALKSGNADALVRSLRKEGYIVNEVTPEQEGILAFRSTVPEVYRDSSIMVDVGSVNTKISWEEKGQLKALETYGTKYFEAGLAPKQVFDEVVEIMKDIPAEKKKQVFIIGDVPYGLARSIREQQQRYVVLNQPASYQPKNDKEEAGLNIYNAMVRDTGTEVRYIFDFDAHYAIGFLQGLVK